MKLHEFIDQEFKKIAANELNQLFDEQQSKSLFVMIDDIFLGEDFDNLEELTELIKSDKNLIKLKHTCFILDQLVKIDDFEFSLSDLRIIKKRIENEPENKLFPLIWVYQELNVFKKEEFFETEVADFFVVLFDNYDYLVELEDFFDETRISTEILWQERLKNSNELLYPVFVNAIEKYPFNLYLKRILGYICYFKSNYNESITLLKSVIDAIHERNIFIDELHYLEIIEYMAMNYDKLGENEKMSECVKYVLSNLPVMEDDKGKETEVPSWAIDSFFLRMRLNMKNNDKQKVIDDFNKIKEDLYLWEWENDYPDVMNYIEELKY